MNCKKRSQWPVADRKRQKQQLRRGSASPVSRSSAGLAGSSSRSSYWELKITSGRVAVDFRRFQGTFTVGSRPHQRSGSRTTRTLCAVAGRLSEAARAARARATDRLGLALAYNSCVTLGSQ
ncbi:hypothetical protein J6590_052146 [Homalodisca vitripennis]|nr:hypothetical protein J6590_052146 [Homalodisca vitripennis]